MLKDKIISKLIMAVSVLLLGCNPDPGKQKQTVDDSMQPMDVTSFNIEQLYGWTIENRTIGGYDMQYFYDPISCDHINIVFVDRNPRDTTGKKADYILRDFVGRTGKNNLGKIDSAGIVSLAKQKLELFRKMGLRYTEYECKDPKLHVWIKEQHLLHLRDTTELFARYRKEGWSPYDALIHQDTDLYKYKEYSPPY